MEEPLHPPSGTLHRPVHPDTTDESTNDASDDDNFSLHEFDLDVVDEALLNPHNKEFSDHFGFRIHVKTDDELDDDTSDSSDSEDEDKGAFTKKKQPQQKSISTTTTHSSEGEDTDFSVDTAMTTPTHAKAPIDFTATAATAATAAASSTAATATAATHGSGQESFQTRRGRSATVSKPAPAVQPELRTAQPGRRRRATTVSRPNLPPPAPSSSSDQSKPDALVEEQEEPMPGPGPISSGVATPQPRHSHGASSVASAGASTAASQQPPPLPPLPTRSSVASDPEDAWSVRSSSERNYPESVSGRSFASFNPFKRSGSPTPSVRSVPRTVERPSQAFRERQSKRMSEFYRYQSQTPSSPSPSLPGAHRLSGASGYYDMLMSKFGRTSEEQYRDSPKHAALKEETRNALEALRETSTDYDWDFWLSLINDADLVLRTQPDAVKHHMTLGMPPPLRGQLWQIVVRSRNSGDVESEYRELLKRVSPDEKLIRRDLSRTFPTHEFFKEQDGEGQEALFNVIKAYSIFDQQVGYCQGLPFIVGCLLLEMREEHAFAVLIKLMSQHGLRSQYTPNMETLHERLYQFDHILQQKIPQVHRHLETQGVRPSMYASQWFLTLFASRCPLPLTVRLFDLIMVEGTLVVLRVALALLWRNQDTLLTLDMEHLVGFLNYSIYDAYVDDPNALIQDAYNIDIPARLLNRLAKQRTTEAAREAKTQTQEEHLRRINADLSQHVHRLEKANRALESENRDVTQQVIDAKMSVARLDDENQQLRHDLGQVRTELEQLKSTLPALDEMTRQNAYYRQQNQDLHSQLTDVEEILVDLKLKYAESEGRYEELYQRLGATNH